MTESTARWILFLSCICIGLAGFDWLLSPQYPFGDDNSAHYAVGIHIANIFADGEMNFWWHQSNLGIPLFAAYQPLPSLLFGFLVFLFSDIFSPIVLFKSTILLPWMLMPVVWYTGARWYGCNVLFSLSIALLTILIHDPYSIGFGIRSSTFRGLYTQHFGLLFLPVFIGSMKRYLDGTSVKVYTPSILFSLTLMSHLWVGLYAAIIIVTLIISQPRIMVHRLKGIPKFLGVGFALVGWWMIPLLLTNDFAGGLPWKTEYHNGLSLRKLYTFWMNGSFFDFDRLPILTILIGFGAVILIRRVHKPEVRHLILLSLVTTGLFLGRTNIGLGYDLLPLHSQVNVMRYLTGVHICGIMVAGVTISTLIKYFNGFGKTAIFVKVGIFSSFILFGSYDINSTLRIFKQDDSFKQLVAYLNSLPDHRIMVHGKLGTGNHFHRDLLPYLSGRGQVQSYAHGYHCTLSTYYSEYFDFSPTACDLFNVGSVVAMKPLPKSFPIDAYQTTWENDNYLVMHTQNFENESLFSLVHVNGRITTPDLRLIRPVVKRLMVPTFSKKKVPEIIFNDTIERVLFNTDEGSMDWSVTNSKEILTAINKDEEQLYLGGIISSSRSLSSYTGIVNITSADTWVLLKANYFPFWSATVDGINQPVIHVVPNYMAVKVGVGRHTVHFQYTNPLLQKVGMLMSLLIFIVLIAVTVIQGYVSMKNGTKIEG